MSEAYLGWPGLIAEERTTKAYEGTGIFESASGMVDNASAATCPASPATPSPPALLPWAP